MWGLIIVICQLVTLVCFMSVSLTVPLKPLQLSWRCHCALPLYVISSSACLHLPASYKIVILFVLITYRVNHAFSWKFLKPHMFAIVQDVLFPILSYSQADEELWNTDPYEYIRVKFGKKISCVWFYIYYLTFISSWCLYRIVKKIHTYIKK